LVRRSGHWQEVSQQSSRIRGAASDATIDTIHRKLPPARSAAVDHREQSVREAEHQIADATDKDDADALERLWAPEFVWIGPIGNVLTRAQRLAMIRSGREKSGGYSIDQENIRIYGATAVVTFRSTVAGTIDGKDISSRRRVTNVLVELDGRWQAVSQHSTLIAGD
jgi:ketosteroid isomerase-like protein